MHGRRKEALRGKLVTMGPKIKTKLLKVSMFYSIILFYNIVRVINCLIASLLLKSDISAFSQTCPKIQGGASAHFPSPEAHAHAYIHLYLHTDICYTQNRPAYTQLHRHRTTGYALAKLLPILIMLNILLGLSPQVAIINGIILHSLYRTLLITK